MADVTDQGNDAVVDLQGYAVVRTFDDYEDAAEFQALLEASDVDAVVKEGEEIGQADPFALLVPEDQVDEAYAIVDSQSAYDDFYDMAIEDDEGEFGDDFFDDEL